MRSRPPTRRFGAPAHVRRAAGFCAVLLLACTPASARPVERELLVFGAASLRDALPEIGNAYMRVAPDVRVRLHTAGSTTLRRQIDSGAPADVFVCAGALDMQLLEASGAILKPSIFAANELVIATRSSVPPAARRPDLFGPNTGCLAVGNPRTAPVGRYTRQALEALRPPAGRPPQLVLCENARQITSALASGACDLAIAYRSDVLADRRLRIAWTLADSLHAPIRYLAAPLARAAQNDDAIGFVRFLSSEAARAVLVRHGFVAGSQEPWAVDPTRTDSLAVEADRRARLEPLWLSLRVATLATLLSGVAGLALAAWLARSRAGRGRDVFAAVADLPLVLPPTVIGLVLLEACGPGGPVGTVFERMLGVRLTFTWVAAVLASATMAVPLMVRTARAALESVPGRYVESARTLGATPWSAFWRVQLPLARRGVAAGLVLCFFRALGEFGATLMVAGNIPGRTQTLPLAIYASVFEGRPNEAVLWVILVLVLSWLGALSAHRLARVQHP